MKFSIRIKFFFHKKGFLEEYTPQKAESFTFINDEK